MDFLKALLIYMSVMFAASVQGAVPPGEAPEVTRVPEQIVAQQGYATPDPDAVKMVGSTIITPDPNVTPTPTPAPTITPNPKYTVLRFGDRGANVKKMQQKLIELGYLTGNADGAFGYQTLNAVRVFQKANGLNTDGDAGSITLTQLYENPDVARNPSSPTPTPSAEQIEQLEINTPSDPAAWLQMDGITMLLNGKTLALITEENGVRTQGRLHVWMLEAIPYVSLDELTATVDGWTLESNGPDRCTAHIAGYELCLDAGGEASSAYQDGYHLTVDGTAFPVSTTQAVYLNGRWLASANFLRNVLQANVTWEQEESTMILQVPDKAVAQSAD